jgi:hypothetical protein
MFSRFYAAQKALHTMTATSAAPPPPAVVPAILAAMQCAILAALPPQPGASEGEKTAQREGALDFLAALHPRNPVEATIATGIVVAYYAALDCFRRAVRGDLTVDLHLRTVGKAIALCRMMNVGMRDLARRQGDVAVQQAARPASVRPAPVQPVVQPGPELGARAEPTPETARTTTPPQPPVAEGRHERRKRKWVERHAAAAAQRAGRGPGAVDIAKQQQLLAELAAAQDAACAVAAAV